MLNSLKKRLTSIARAFLEPKNPTHRQYEALRAFFVEGLPSAEAARRFGYSPGSFRVLCHEFRQDPDRQFFLSSHRTPQTPKADRIRDQVVALRRQNLSIYDISQALAEKGDRRSPAGVSLILREEGLPRLQRRTDDERPQTPRPEKAEIADVRSLDLSPREFRTQYGGLFLFVPLLARIPWPDLVKRADLPGSVMIAPEHALRSLLGLKLFGSRRHSHVMADVFDQGLALFAGLNVIPKRSFLTEYSCRIRPSSYPKLMHGWFDAVGKLGLGRGVSFDLDFHTIPFHGEDALVQKHYVSKRSRRQKGLLAFLAQDAEKRVFCYANGQLRKEDQNDEILRFVDFWKEKTGHVPEELIFDSRLTSYANLSRLNKMGISFMTLRRWSRKLLQQIYATPPSAWRRIQLDSIGRIYKTPRILDGRISLPRYEGPIRQLTIMESSLYRLLGLRIGKGYEVAKADHIFRDFVDATAHVTITGKDILVRFQKRAHNPLLLAARLDKTETLVPWLNGSRLRLQFG